MRDRPQNTPLGEWAPAWLRLECAALLDNPAYVTLHDWEKCEAGYPISDDEMRQFIKSFYAANPVEAVRQGMGLL